GGRHRSGGRSGVVATATSPAVAMIDIDVDVAIEVDVAIALPLPVHIGHIAIDVHIAIDAASDVAVHLTHAAARDTPRRKSTTAPGSEYRSDTQQDDDRQDARLTQD